MNDKWNVKVKTHDGKEEEFVALSCYEPTEEQKLLWKTMMGDKEITAMRVAKVVERKVQDG